MIVDRHKNMSEFYTCVYMFTLGGTALPSLGNRFIYHMREEEFTVVNDLK